MSNATGSQAQFGTGPLSRVVARIYSLLAIEVLLLLTTLPGLVPLVLLDRDASNLPLVAACAVPLGPALSAALYALRQHHPDLTDLRPAAAFWRGYTANALGVLRVWLPALAVLTVIGVNLTHLRAAAVPRWWAVLLVLVAVAVTLCSVNALVISSLFAFRARDTARLAAYCLAHTPGVTVGNAGLLLAAAGITVLWSEAVLALFGSLLALALLHTCRPMISKIQEEFTG
jgi:hypothetical protein